MDNKISHIDHVPGGWELHMKNAAIIFLTHADVVNLSDRFYGVKELKPAPGEEKR